MSRNLPRAFLAPDTESTIDISGDEYLRIISERDVERQNRYRAEAELARIKAELSIVSAELDITQLKLADAQRRLVEYESKPWSSNIWDAAQNMGPGEAFIATVAAPVMTAPLAAATVVKGFQSVGTGIASLFQKKDKDKTPNNQPPPPAASRAPETPTPTPAPPNPPPS